MKQLSWIALLLAGVAHADIWTPYDGDGSQANTDAPTMQAGMTTSRFNAAAWLRWDNDGGDWTDADGERQGNAPFVVGSAVDGVVSMDVTSMIGVEGFVLRAVPRSVLSLKSRESDTSPELRLTMADGSEVVMLPIADASLSKSTTKPQGKSRNLNVYDAAVVAFAKWPEGVVSARLVLAVASGAGKVGVFALHIPRQPIPEPGTGYSAQYPRDIGIESDPRTIYAESWDRPNGARPFDWWEKTGQQGKPTLQWKQDGGLFLRPDWSGMWIADGSGAVKAQCSDLLLDRGLGYIGDGLTGIHCRDILARGATVPTVYFRPLTGGQIDEAWSRYMIKYDRQHVASARCEGGKAPGFAGITTYGGNSGNPGYGLGGWSMRNQFHPICDPNNPAYGGISFSTYAYDGDRFHDLNGGHWGDGELAVLPLEQWACIEQHVKINTPGQWDGVVELFVNGRQVLSKTDAYMRSERPPQGYGDWQLISNTYPAPEGAVLFTDARGKRFYWKGRTQPGENSIDMFWGKVHWGGKTPSGADHQFWLDQTVVATERVGCPNMGDAVPPPPPPTELELAQEALRLAQEALAEAMATIDAMETQADASAAQMAELEAAAAEAEERASAAQAIIEQIRILTIGAGND